MAQIQKQFEAFHEVIKLGRFEEEQILRDKRDIIKAKLNSQLPEIFKKHRESCPTFSFCDQGSYDLGTGIIPLDGDYDIDQGLYFETSVNAYPDPVLLKKRVYEALDGHTEQVRIRRSCVTVFYHQGDEQLYHVDIAVYSDGSKNADGKHRLAKGKENSAKEHRFWEISDPQGFADTIFARFKGGDREQFRRIVRYLKRWKDQNFSKDGNAAPLGIGLTVAAYDHLQPTYFDRFAGKADDLGAMRALVQGVINRFGYAWDADEQKLVQRLVVKLPVEPYGDLFGRMTSQQMGDFEDKLKKLLKALDAAADEVDPVEACKKLKKVFGQDFPVPAPEETAKRYSSPAIVSSSHSA